MSPAATQKPRASTILIVDDTPANVLLLVRMLTERGYPNGKRADATPVAARIVNLCDIYDALRSKRPYKPAFGHARTVEVIAHGDGRTQPEHFDPAILAVFVRNDRLFGDIFEARTG